MKFEVHKAEDERLKQEVKDEIDMQTLWK